MNEESAPRIEKSVVVGKLQGSVDYPAGATESPGYYPLPSTRYGYFLILNNGRRQPVTEEEYHSVAVGEEFTYVIGETDVDGCLIATTVMILGLVGIIILLILLFPPR